MFLKSLVIRGFKSFAEKTTLVFEPGITIVVGPNGSGKSNVVDAISWVLGEQGPRSLRGGRMEDVIFAGSPGRPALGMAEVSLTIDNSANLLPIDFSEVNISRTLFRSGESEYRLNGALCRLLDIQEVLSDTGVGREQHTIVGQGRLDEVLNAGPDQLRGFIEEAAGIGKHRRRRERASRKITATEQNMVRLSDLLSEVRRQLRPLREQAEVATRQKRMSEEHSRIELILASRGLAGARAGLAPDGGGADLESQIEGRRRELGETERAIGELEAERAEGFVLSERHKEAAWRLARGVERLRALSLLALERVRSLEAQLAVETEVAARIRVDELMRQAGEFEESLHEAIDKEREAAERQDRESAPTGPGDVDVSVERLEASIRGLGARAGELTELYRSTSSELEELNSQAIQVVNRPDQGAAAALSRTVAIFQSRIAEIESVFRRFEEELEALGGAHVAALEAHRRASTEREESTGIVAMATARRKVLEERLDSARAALEAAREAVSTVAGRRRELAESIAHAGRISHAALAISEEASAWAREAGEAYRSSGLAVEQLDERIDGLKKRRGALSEELDGMRTRAREQDLTRTEVTFKARMLEEKIRSGWDLEPDKAVVRFGQKLEFDDPAALEKLDAVERLAALDDEQLDRKRSRLERELASMGQVNPLASDQFEALSQREHFLSGQLGDLRSSRRDLQAVAESVDQKIQELFGAAFNDVAAQFERLFAVLFPGGRGSLRLTDAGDLLGAGVEVEARPGGKNLKRLSLLSGGERALSALALLFAIFRARPSPFYILDEVEAALDDVNLHRFLRLLQEFRESSQLLVVTHQKRTMEIADVLYGVSIGKDGASKVISERLSARAGDYEDVVN